MEKIKNQFEKFENDNNLNELNISWYPAWEIVRFFVLQEIFIQKWKTKQAIYPRKNIFLYVLKNIFNISRNIFNLFILFLKKDKYELFFLWHPRRQKQDDWYYYDIYTDYIKKECKKRKLKYISFEETYFNFYSPINKNSNILYKLDLLYIYFLLTIKFVKINKKELLLIKNIEDKLNKEFWIKINLLNRIKRDITLFSILVKFYDKLLIKLWVKNIIEVVWFSIWAKALNFSAKSKSIPTYELQHWTIVDNLACSLPEYFSWKTLPDYFLSYWKFWNNVIKFPKKQNIIDVWFPYFENLLKNKKESLSDDILIISQWNISDKLSLYTKKIALKYPNKNFYYKLHPWEFLNDCIIKNNLDNIKNVILVYDEYSVYDLMYKTWISIGVSSTSLYESFLFWNKIFILSINDDYKVFNYFIERQLFSLIKSDDFLLNIDIKNNNVSREYFLTKNWLNNILKLITK